MNVQKWLAAAKGCAVPSIDCSIPAWGATSKAQTVGASQKSEHPVKYAYKDLQEQCGAFQHFAMLEQDSAEHGRFWIGTRGDDIL